MQDKIFIKPAEGRQVRDPITKEPLAAEGDSKPRNSYWLRRVKEGDVVISSPVKKKAEKGGDKS